MGRKSLKAENTVKILDALEQCIEQKGVRGTTLEEVANKAGMARRMVLHYIGNRDELMQALAGRIISQYSTSAFDFIAANPATDFVESTLDFLFGDAFYDHPKSQVMSALLQESLSNEEIAAALKPIYATFWQEISSNLKTISLENEQTKIEDTAFAVMTLSFGNYWMSKIMFDRERSQANRRIAEQLIRSLVSL